MKSYRTHVTHLRAVQTANVEHSMVKVSAHAFLDTLEFHPLADQSAYRALSVR